MRPARVTMDGASFRTADAAQLAQALQSSRHDTLAMLALYEAARPALQVPLHDELNPPRWEVGHIHWFQQWWLARNPQRAQGVAADPQAPRASPVRPDSDTLFDSSRVPHGSRWRLPLPEAAALRAMLDEGLSRTLRLLDDAGADDRGLYFHRLVLAHEDMHHEAALYMAQALGIAIPDARWQPPRLARDRSALHIVGGPQRLGWAAGGFAFDNELGAFDVQLPAFDIDSRVLSWADFLPFVDSGAYAQPRWWSAAGRAWQGAQQAGQQAARPRYLRRQGSGWQQQRGGAWQALDEQLPACHLSAHEAEAWCAWAGRRLPTEAEWERAAFTAGSAFAWGAVWEWTASDFRPYPGFVPHPYLDYSAPWFGSRRVLRGASFATQPRLHERRYRNFYEPRRNDIFAGFRTCSVDAAQGRGRQKASKRNVRKPNTPG